jgi:hypothetical protein
MDERCCSLSTRRPDARRSERLEPVVTSGAISRATVLK